MRIPWKYCLILYYIFLFSTAILPQKRTLYDFFPHHVGDCWQYTTIEGICTLNYSSYKEFISKIDTVWADTAKYIYYNNSTTPSFKIKLYDSARVYYKYHEEWKVYMDFSTPEKGYWSPGYSTQTYIYLDSVLQRTDNGKIYRTLKYYTLGIEPKNGYAGGILDIFYYEEGVGFTGREFEIGMTFLTGYIINGINYSYPISIEEEKKRPITKNSIKNYPNPFNSETRIVYELSSASDISVRVFDIVGREVAIIEEGYKEAGSYTRYWNPRNIASGTYIIVFRSNNSFLTRKMIYLK